MKKILCLLALAAMSVACIAQTSYAYPTRRAIIANVCPFLKLTSFSFDSVYERSMTRFKSDYAWENVGDKPILAFELIILRYDVFNRPDIGVRTVFPGHNSATYKPLAPSEKDSDGGSSLTGDDLYTCVAYVRNIRFVDGTIWTAAPADVIKSIKTQVPDILEVGPLAPEKKKQEEGK
jgi:hypothetical protein